MSKSSNIISVHNLTKRYELGAKPIKKLHKSLFAKSQSLDNHPNKQIVALDKVTFDLEKGSSLGIVGLNGSGKSTLLQIIANTLKPSSGTVKVNGSVSALLELGCGFNPDFTGRENCLLNGALMGNSKKKTTQKIPEIEDFAEIGEFFDMPLRTYSTGMQMRLAFALATSFQPDVLIVDESLSVGDKYFQAKCFEKISKLKNAGMSLILVTHSVNDIPKYCEHALLLNKGRIISYGKPREITNLYLESLHKETLVNNNSDVLDFEQLSFKSETFHKRPYYRKEEHRWGNKKARILDYLIQNEKNDIFPKNVRSSELLSISYSVVFDSFVENVIPGFLIKSIDGNFLYGTNNKNSLGSNENISAYKGDVHTFTFEVKLKLNTGSYLISLGVSSLEGQEFIPLDRRYDSILIDVDCVNEVWGLIDLEANFRKTIQ